MLCSLNKADCCVLDFQSCAAVEVWCSCYVQITIEEASKPVVWPTLECPNPSLFSVTISVKRVLFTWVAHFQKAQLLIGPERNDVN
jgi:hypothetical protein